MQLKKIEWITFNAFLDTDIYIVKELSKYYKINWHILKSKNDTIDYLESLQEIQKSNIREHLSIDIIECGKRLRNLACITSYKKLLKSISGSNYDLLYTSLAGAPYYIFALKRYISTKKIVLGIHNVHVPKGGSNQVFFKFYNKYAINAFDNFQTFSVSQCNYLKEIKPNKTVYYAPFILKDFGSPTGERTDEKITFLNFGNIRPYKCIDNLIVAAQKAYEETGVLFRVIIAGKCDNWDYYERQIRYPELFDIRIGRVENKDIPDLFNETDYFVAPYQDIAQSGSAMVAINYEKPMIVSKLPAFEECVKEGYNGYFVRPGDVDSLFDTIVNALSSHADNYYQLKKNQVHIKKSLFSLDSVVDKYREFIDETIVKSN